MELSELKVTDQGHDVNIVYLFVWYRFITQRADHRRQNINPFKGRGVNWLHFAIQV